MDAERERSRVADGREGLSPRRFPALFLFIVALACGLLFLSGKGISPLAALQEPCPTIPFPGPQLPLAIVPSSIVAALDQPFAVQITVGNVHNSPATLVELRLEYPAECLTYLSATPPGADNGAGRVYWADLTVPLGDLPPGGSFAVEVWFRPTDLCQGEIRARVYGEYPSCYIAPYSYATASLSVQLTLPTATPTVTPTPGGAPALQVTKRILEPASGLATVGDLVTYRITLRNLSSVTATRVGATDDYPQSCLRFHSASVAGTDDGDRYVWQDLTWTLGDVAPGATIAVDVRYEAIAPCASATNYFLAYGTYQNEAPIPWSRAQATLAIQPAPTYTPTRTPTAGISCLGGFADYAPRGMPDFDQRQGGWTNIRTGAWSYCGPVAAANVLWWFDSRFETNTLPWPHVEDNYPLVPSFTPGRWDDHAPRNLPDLVASLAYLMDTDGQRTGNLAQGTDPADLAQGLLSYIADRGLQDYYAVAVQEAPSLAWVQDLASWGDRMVLLLLGFWEHQGAWRRLGGHYVTVACISWSGEARLALADPFSDRAELGWPGYVYPAPPHGHPTNPPDEVHNDADYVSWELYDAIPSSVPAGIWGLSGYASSYDDVANFFGQNFPHDLEEYRADSYREGAIETVVERAIVISWGQPSPTATPTETWMPTVSPTPTATPTETFTATWTPSPTAIDSLTPTPTGTPTVTPTETSTPTWTPTATESVTATPEVTSTATWTPTGAPSDTPTATWTPSTVPSDTPTATPTATWTSSPTATTTRIPTATATPTARVIYLMMLLKFWRWPSP